MPKLMNLPKLMGFGFLESDFTGMDFAWITDIFTEWAKQMQTGVIGVFKATLPVILVILGIVIVIGVVIAQGNKVGKVAKH